MDDELTLSAAVLSHFLFLSSIFTAKLSCFEAPIPLERGKEFTAWRAWICEYSVGWGGFVLCTVQYMFAVNIACWMMSFLHCSAVEETIRGLAAAVIGEW